VEFFFEHWERLGRLNLGLMNYGIHQQRFEKHFTAGNTIVIPKIGPQVDFTNKRPTTLLNTPYKIATKAFAERIKKIAMKVISQHQSGFLLGRSIHRTLLMNNEMVYREKASEEDFIFMKLDAIKAFDSVEWDFLIKFWNRCMY
jgi:hypothetical protein